MKTKVVEVLSDLVFRTEDVWKYFNQKGFLIKIAGLLPSDFNNRNKDIKKLRTLITVKGSNLLLSLANFYCITMLCPDH